MNIFIVGCEGQLGSSLQKSLRQRGWAVTGFSRRDLDITELPAVESLIVNHKPDVIINAAAYTAVENAEGDPADANVVNNLAVRNLAKVAHKINALLIHFSTDYVFNGEKQQPYVESDNTDPINVYGKTKLAGEKAIAEETDRYYIIRTSWLFSGSGNNFVTKMLSLLSSSAELNVVNDQQGGPTYVGDLADVVVNILQSSSEHPIPWGIYHYGGYPFVSWYDFAAYIQAELPGASACVLRAVTSDGYPSRVKRPLNSSLDSSRLTSLLAIAPSDWQQAVKAIVAQEVRL